MIFGGDSKRRKVVLVAQRLEIATEEQEVDLFMLDALVLGYAVVDR